MPPSPLLNIGLSEPAWDRLCEELGFTRRPTVTFPSTKRGRHGMTWSGVYHAGRDTIEVFTGYDDYTRDRLTSVAYELSRVVLHEARHAWQYRNWTRGQLDNVVEKERDAIQFEDRLADYRLLVRVTRRHVGGGLSKLSAAQRNVRQ
jgi:hypothetical protein